MKDTAVTPSPLWLRVLPSSESHRPRRLVETRTSRGGTLGDECCPLAATTTAAAAGHAPLRACRLARVAGERRRPDAPRHAPHRRPAGRFGGCERGERLIRKGLLAVWCPARPRPLGSAAEVRGSRACWIVTVYAAAADGFAAPRQSRGREPPVAMRSRSPHHDASDFKSVRIFGFQIIMARSRPLS